LLTLIASTATSPFKKKNIQSQNQGGNQSYGLENSSNASGGETHSEKDGNSSVNTPKFANSFTSQTTPAAGQNPQGGIDQDRISEEGAKIRVSDEAGIFSHTQVEEKDALSQSSNSFNPKKNNGGLNRKAVGHVQNINTQVDDFPKLIEQMSQKGIAKNILDNVVDFASLIKKLLVIVETSTCIFKNLKDLPVENKQSSKQDKATSNQDPVPLLVQNCLDLLLPCILWEPTQLMEQLYKFQHFERLMISGLIKSKNETIRKSIEQTFKVLCHHIEDKQAKEEAATKQATHKEPVGSGSSLVADD
jgi:hypothetical protein